MTKKFEKVGGGQYGIYRPKKTDWSAVLGCIVMAVVALLVIANLGG